MFNTELVSSIAIDPMFHKYAEQITGSNSATVVQKNKRPKGLIAYTLSYFKAFSDPESDTSDIKALLGMAHFVMVSAGQELDISEVTSFPHGLRCLSSPINRQGMLGVLFAGDGEQWLTSIRIAGLGSLIVQDWGRSCYNAFAKNNLDELFGKIKAAENTQYLLE